LMCSWHTFSPTLDVLFSLETISFDKQKLFSFMKSHFSMLSLSCCAAGVPLRKFLPIPYCFWWVEFFLSIGFILGFFFFLILYDFKFI
jgi:hypothetical protein